MTISEKVAYLKGLVAGLELDETKKETKVFNAIIDVLDEVAASVTDCEDDIISMGEELDEITESVSDLEDAVYDDEDDDEDFSEFEDDDDDEDDDDCCCCEDCDDDCDCDDECDTFEFASPDCGEKLFIELKEIENGVVKCKACGREIEFEVVEDCGCEDCDDCDCDDCKDKDKE